MAESIIYGLVQTMIENLGSQIFQEIGKICSLKKELEKLKKTVSRIQAIYSRMQRSNKFIAIKSRTGSTGAVRKKLSDIAMDHRDFKLKVFPIEKHDASIEREEDTIMIQTTGDQHVHVPALG
uniref:Uncharacterized protein n=1 Tax=Quercus lobata TaxID=97700 RepID=A0A7N2LCE1_QUELO